MFPNTLRDLGVAINLMTNEIMNNLNIHNLMRQISILLQMANKSMIKHEGILEDIIITLHSWEYLVDFLILHTKTNAWRYPLILG